MIQDYITYLIVLLATIYTLYNFGKIVFVKKQVGHQCGNCADKCSIQLILPIEEKNKEKKIKSFL
jgi:hypothetical protein